MKERTLFLQLFYLKKTIKPDCLLSVEVFLIILYIVIDLIGAVLASLITVRIGQEGGGTLNEMEWPLPAKCQFL